MSLARLVWLAMAMAMAMDVDADEVKRKKRSTRRDHERLAQSATPDVRCPPGTREPPSMPPPACTSVHSAHTLGLSLTQAQGLDRRHRRHRPPLTAHATPQTDLTPYSTT